MTNTFQMYYIDIGISIWYRWENSWWIFFNISDYRKVSSIRRTLVGNEIVDHSDVVGASPVGAAPTTSSFSTEHLASMD